MEQMRQSSPISAGNAAYVEQLYEQYLTHPAALPDPWRRYFDSLSQSQELATGPEISHAAIREDFRRLAKQQTGSGDTLQPHDTEHARKQFAVSEIITGYRRRGHLKANLDPLSIRKPILVPMLELGFNELSEDDLDIRFQTNLLLFGDQERTLREIIQLLETAYCSSIGAEYMHIASEAEQMWVQHRIEAAHALPPFTEGVKKRILRRLIAAEGLEKYLGTRYPGTKRFGIEGGESFIPCLAELIHRAGSSGIVETVIGMAHRGRINVLVNLMGKKPAELFDEFEGRYMPDFGSGDVKYHQGFSSHLTTPGGEMHLALGFNPSHLEISAPVIVGSVRARMDRRKDPRGDKVLAIYVHGDAALSGQGVVMETFQMSQTRGFFSGGTIHIVINNQIGYTTTEQVDARSTHYCTEVAKMVQAPIFHVNGDDPEAVLFVSQMALDYRMEFKKDVVIDIVCYRRRGHNEGDEPSITQPLMYQKIRNQPTTLAGYAEKIIAEGVLTQEEYTPLVEQYRDLMDRGEPVAWDCVHAPNTAMFVDWAPYLGHDWDAPGDTSFKLARFKTLIQKVEQLPPGFVLQKQVAKMFKERQEMSAGKRPINWGYAEIMAYATLLDQGFGVRLTGQDVCRGTFSHRHAVLHDQKTGGIWTPLEALASADHPLTFYNSFLSEEAVLAFEYGYSQTRPDTLVIWEAQFGDFANGAQIVIDQFITSGEHKWSRLSGLTMLLPHGYEGAGPEHSSARLERYLQLCAEHNVQVCVPSTPAQMFHLLRRQAIRPLRRPLIVMTPKNLLRHREAVSTLDELCHGEFKAVIPDPWLPAVNGKGRSPARAAPAHKKQVRRIIFCSGKVYYDLHAKRLKDGLTPVALTRIEQLYPFPEAALQNVLEEYPQIDTLIWCQEEPMNQGAWYSSQHHLRRVLQRVFPGLPLHYTGREASAAAAAGYMPLHLRQQEALVQDALYNTGKE